MIKKRILTHGALRSGRLLRGVEACAHQHTRGAKHECRCQPAAIGNSPCSHDRGAPSKRIHNLWNECNKDPAILHDHLP